MRWWIFIAVFCLPMIAGAQQFYTSIDTAFIGETIEVKWNLNITNALTETTATWKSCDGNTKDTADIDLEWQENAGTGYVIKQDSLVILPGYDEGSIKIIFFDPGSFCFTNRDQTLARIYIRGTEESKEDISDIMGLEEFKSAKHSYLYWLVGLLIFVSGLAFYLWHKKKKQNQRYAEPGTLHVKSAREMVNDILLMKHEDETIAEAAVSMSAAIRQFCFEQYGIKAFELTSTDLLHQLNRKANQKYTFELLSQILRTTDAVKFAKGKILWSEIDEYCNSLLHLMPQKNGSHGTPE